MIYQLHLQTHDKWMRNAAVAICSIPALFFMIFAVGEMESGYMGGMIHLLQILILGLFLYIAIKNAYIGGLLMLFSGLILSMEYVSRMNHLPMQAMLVVVFLIFIPMIAAGILFISYARGHRDDS